MKITAYGWRPDRVAHSGECIGISGNWAGVDRRQSRNFTRIVIDAGFDRDRTVMRAVSRRDPDVFILTHDDGDHIGGARRALRHLASQPRTSPFPRQVWLPAEWWYVVAAWGAAAQQPSQLGNQPTDIDAGDLAAVAQDAHAGVDALPGMESIDGDETPNPDQNTIERLRRWLADLPQNKPEELDAGRIADAISNQGDRHGQSWGHEFSGDPGAVAKRVIQRSRRLVDIVRLAAAVAEIRWFAFDSNLKSRPRWQYVGIPGVVTLLNAREVAIPSAAIADPTNVLLQAYRLTVQNRRALVAYVWPDLTAAARGLGGFINWSDSNGSGCDPAGSSGFTPWREAGIMTAPHHASAALNGANAPVAGGYEHGEIWAGRPCSIRVLLSANNQDTIPYYSWIPWCRRAATQIDKSILNGRRFPRPRDAFALMGAKNWLLAGCR